MAVIIIFAIIGFIITLAAFAVIQAAGRAARAEERERLRVMGYTTLTLSEDYEALKKIPAAPKGVLYYKGEVMPDGVPEIQVDFSQKAKAQMDAVMDKLNGLDKAMRKWEHLARHSKKTRVRKKYEKKLKVFGVPLSDAKVWLRTGGHFGGAKAGTFRWGARR